MNNELIRFDILLIAAIFDEPFGQSGLLAMRNHPADHITAENINNYIQIIICPFGRPFDLGVSSPEESHHRALSEPDVNLSAHPAPIVPAQGTKPACQWGKRLG